MFQPAHFRGDYLLSNIGHVGAAEQLRDFAISGWVSSLKLLESFLEALSGAARIDRLCEVVEVRQLLHSFLMSRNLPQHMLLSHELVQIWLHLLKHLRSKDVDIKNSGA